MVLTIADLPMAGSSNRRSAAERLPSPDDLSDDVAAALADAAAAIARIDQALANHPLRPAFLYRARLLAVRRQAAVDGQLIDPWHLAAVLEGLRLQMDHGLHIVDRGAIFEAARYALGQHQWLVEPDFDQDGEVQRAEAALAVQAARAPPLCSRRPTGCMPGSTRAASARPCAVQ